MEILYLAHNRRAFTEVSLAALLANTSWNRVSGIVLYDDNSTDGTAEVLERFVDRFPVVPRLVERVNFSSPVAVMNHYISTRHADLFCKIDSDTMVPPGWLDDCLDVMSRHPWLDLLGIEAWRSVEVSPRPGRMVDVAAHIGGIGLMRGRAFEYSLPRPDGRFGFTAWQQNAVKDKGEPIRAGWLNPALPVALLDRLPIEPWASLSREYVANGWQRHWPPYSLEQSNLWEWFI